MTLEQEETLRTSWLRHDLKDICTMEALDKMIKTFEKKENAEEGDEFMHEADERDWARTNEARRLGHFQKNQNTDHYGI